MNRKFLNPFDSKRYIGTVTAVNPNTCIINLPFCLEGNNMNLYGNKISYGAVGDFVIFDCAQYAIFGRITYVRLPGSERLGIEKEYNISKDCHPIGNIQLLTTIDLNTEKVIKGIKISPVLGANVYSAHTNHIKFIAENSGNFSSFQIIKFNIAKILDSSDTEVGFTPESIFGRHCAIVGSTGGGKSWTVATIIEQCKKYKSKIILIDAIGEYHKISGNNIKHIEINGSKNPVSVPYNDLEIIDLFSIFTPSGQTQNPVLRTPKKP